ncbi:MAG: DUF4115 domain-containing protein, partial [bacterium]|nr:DUF4115 domain-containing protein [bacterium]
MRPEDAMAREQEELDKLAAATAAKKQPAPAGAKPVNPTSAAAATSSAAQQKPVVPTPGAAPTPV